MTIQAATSTPEAEGDFEAFHEQIEAMEKLPDLMVMVQHL